MFLDFKDAHGVDGEQLPLRLDDAVKFQGTTKFGGVVVPDAHLLFSGDFKRAGLDLVLSHDDRHFVVRDYFKGESRATLLSPDGASLSGHTVNALAGYVDVAQAGGNTSAAAIIGTVVKLTGNATAIRNGVVVTLNIGDKVYKGDVVQSGSDSALGVSFIDGTAFSLGSNARMVLNDMVYDPNGSSNSSLISLVQGTISFVAGETAKHGNMKVDTPVATMGIRGTAVVVEMTADNGPVKFSVVVEPGGRSGSYVLLDKITGSPITMVNQPGLITFVSPTGINQPLSIVELQKTPADLLAEREIVKLAFSIAFPQFNFDDANPKTRFGMGSSGNNLADGGNLSNTAGGTTSFTFIVTALNKGTNSTGFGADAFATPDIFIPPQITTHVFHPVTWIHPTAGLWNDGSNWGTGTVPTAGDDVFISYAVTITTPANAYTVTLNATGAQIINDSTLTIADALTLFADGVLNNSGTVGIRGQMELLNQSSLQNAGFIILGQGGDFKDQSTVSNTSTGTIEVSGGTLNVLVDVANSGLLTVDPNGTLMLNGAGIIGGTVTNHGIVDFIGAAVLKNGALGNSGQVNVSGNSNALDGETVSNLGTINVNGVLTLDLGTSITGGILTNSGIFKIEASGATLDGVSVENSSGIIQVDDFLSPDASTLVLDNGTTITGGTVTIGPVGTLEVVTALGATLDGVSVSNSGTVQVDEGSVLNMNGATVTGGIVTDNGTVKVSAGKTLNLSGVALTGGSINNLGTVDIIGDSSITNDALSNTQLTVDGGKTLTLDGTTVTGGIVTDNGTIHVTGDSAIDNTSMTAGQVTVDFTKTLTLDGATVTGGIMTDNGTVKVSAGKTLNLSGVALTGGSINNLGTVDIIGDSSITNDALSNTQLTVDGGKTLTLNGTTVTGGIVTDNGTIHVTGDSAIDNTSMTAGQVTVDFTKTLTLDGATVTGGIVTDNGTVKVSAGKTLNLSGVALTGGSINNLGTVDIIGDSSITNDALSNTQLTVDGGKTLTLNGTTVTGGAITDEGTIKIDGGQTLKLNGVAFSGGTISNAGTIEIIDSSGINLAAIANNQLTVDSGQILTLNEATITGGTVTDNGEIDLTGTAVLKQGTLGNAGQIKVSGLGNALDGETVIANNLLEIVGGGALLIDQGSTVANNGGTVMVDATGTLTLNSATITGGTVTDNGKIFAIATVNITGNITGTGAIEIFNNAQIEIGGSVASTETVFFDGVQGELILDHSLQFAGLITGSSVGTSITPNDRIDLRDLAFILNSMSETVSYNSSLNISTVTFSDGNHLNDIAIRLSGNYTDDSWVFASDGNVSGGTLVELASTDHWINSSGGIWSDPLNWSAGVPGLNVNVALDAPGTYTVTSMGSVDISNMIVDAGVTLLTEPGTLFTVEGNVTNNGEIDAGPFSQNFISTIDIKGNVTGTGLFVISDKAVLEFGGSVSAGEIVQFSSGQGEIILDHAAQFHGLIESSSKGTPLSTGNLIDLMDLSFTSSMSAVVDYNKTTNISSVDFSNGTDTINLQFFGKDLSWSFISDGHGGTIVADPPLSGIATIDNGMTLDISSASSETVTFANDSGTTGTLVLHDSREFTGVITGFAGDGTLSNSDLIDLKDFAFSSLSNETYVENSDGAGGTLTLSDGTQTTHINFSGNYVLQNFSFSSDGAGGTLIIDPPVSTAESSASGTATIVDKAILDFETPTTTNVVFSAGAAGTLKLGDSFHFTGTIAGFGGSDVIDLADVKSAGASISYHENVAGTGGTLTISDGSQVAELSLSGNYSADHFSIVPDQVKGASITYVPHDLIV
jgi:FecR protein